MLKIDQLLLEYVPDEFKTRDICDKALLKEVCCVEHVPDYFITDKICDQVEEKLENVYDDKSRMIYDRINAYKERKNLKLKLARDLLPVAWHPSRAVDWCFDEDDKKYIP